MIVYLWTAVPVDSPEAHSRLGITDDEGAALAAAERCLRDGHARLAFVETASRVTAAYTFSPCYLPTGAGWWATRSPGGEVQWIRFTRTDAGGGLRALVESAELGAGS